MKTIILKLAAPLQAWGTDSRFETRYTDRYPSKSAIIGLIAASMGYRRDEDEKIKPLQGLDFAVRIDQPGKIARDYQIATKYKNNGDVERTYVTNRYYLEDATFVVAIGGEDHLMDQIETALRFPYFQPFLGRRAMPINADFLLLITKDNVIDSLKKLPWQASSWYQNKKGRINKDKNTETLDIYSDSDLMASNNQVMKRDGFHSFSQKRRQHQFRSVGKMVVEIPIDNSVETEHDALQALGGSYVPITSRN